MPQADISCDLCGMLALSEAFELLHQVPDVLRLDHPDCQQHYLRLDLCQFQSCAT